MTRVLFTMAVLVLAAPAFAGEFNKTLSVGDARRRGRAWRGPTARSTRWRT